MLTKRQDRSSTAIVKQFFAVDRASLIRELSDQWVSEFRAAKTTTIEGNDELEELEHNQENALIDELLDAGVDVDVDEFDAWAPAIYEIIIDAQKHAKRALKSLKESETTQDSPLSPLLRRYFGMDVDG